MIFLATKAATEQLSNKTLVSPVIGGNADTNGSFDDVQPLLPALEWPV